METIQRKSKFLILLFFVIVIISCDNNSIFNTYKPIENNTWELNDKVEFKFSINDTLSRRNVFINIRNNNEYKYSNLYLITTLVFPNKTKVIDTLQYKMADVSGKFLGAGFTELKENKLFYKEEKVFPVSGEYFFSVRHAMRKNGFSKGIKSLEGITDVGLSIEKTN